MTTPPKRDARAVLATGGLLLVPLAALWLLLAPAHSGRHGRGLLPHPGEGRTDGQGQPAQGDAPTGPGWPALPIPSTLPPPRVAAGAPTQAGWTLLALTLTPRNGFLTPPGSLAPPPGGREPAALGRNPLLQGASGAVGLWIGVRDGTGVKTLKIPQDGIRHAYPFGRFSLVSLPQPSVGNGGAVRTLLQWQETGLVSPLDRGFDRGDQAPYRMSSTLALAPPGHPAILTVTLTPSPFSGRFRITALPLSAAGRPTGSAVSLRCQPVTATALFAQIPAGYNAATRQFRVSVARAGGETKPGAKNGVASWLITGLPSAVQDGADAPAGTALARVGPFALRAVAAEAEDTSGDADPSSRHPDRPGGPYSQNIDQHQWTGLPTIRYLLLARAASPLVPGQTWLLQLDRVSPQWSAPPPPVPNSVQAADADRPLGFLPLASSYIRPASHDWVLQDGAVGAAYPGQQSRVKIDGTAIRQASRTETVTFHDADVLWDPGFGGDRIVWRHPETETTPSGIAVTVLNGRPGKRDTPAPPSSGQSFGQGYGQGYGQNWWYDRGNAELLLAWRLPPGLVSGQRAALNTPHVALLPQGAIPPPGGGPMKPGLLFASWDSARPDPYIGAVAVPGNVDARPLAQAGYAPLRLSVWATAMPKRTLAPQPFAPAQFPQPGQPFPPVRPPLPAVLPRYSWREGPFVLSAAPLPRHLPTLTLQITVREEKERRPVHLVAPVSATLPPGTDPTPTARRAAPVLIPAPPPSSLHRVMQAWGIGGANGARAVK